MSAQDGTLIEARFVLNFMNEREAADCAGALLALVMGVTTLRKTGVPTTQLKSLLAQADHLLPRKNSLERNTHDHVTAPRRI